MPLSARFEPLRAASSQREASQLLREAWSPERREAY
jgi:hypothetical protein